MKSLITKTILFILTSVIIGNTINETQPIAKNNLNSIITHIQKKSNLAPVKFSDITEGTLVIKEGESGLYQPMPNLNTIVNVNIEGMIASTTVDQHYINDTNEIIETIYIFPLSANCAVRDMEMIIGDRHIKGEVEEKVEARKKYEQAKSQGKKAGLTEQERPNIFTNSVANILPGEHVIIRLKLVEKLYYEEGKFSYKFPMVVGPRFIPGNTIRGYSGTGWALDTDIVPDASRITPPIIPEGMRTGNNLSISIKLNAGLSVGKLLSPTHKIESENIDEHYNITLEHQAIIPNKDFILEYSIKPENQPQAALFTSTFNNEEYFLLMAMPPQIKGNIKIINKEIIFILDISGSMQGTKILQAKSALIEILNRLKPQESFNIIAFNNNYSSFNSNSLPANDENKHRGINFINQLYANGGTMAQPALEAGFNFTPQSDKMKMVVFLTDGSVGNENQLFNLVENKLGNSRLFTLAIGHASNGYLLEKISELGKGTFTYIHNQNQVNEKVTELFSKIENPIITDLLLELPSDCEIYPKTLPDLYKGQPLTVIGKLNEISDEKVKFSGNLNGNRFIQHLSLDLNQAKPAEGISTIWARMKVKELMDDFRRGGQESKQHIIDVAKSFKIVTQFTSFIAIEDKITNPALAYNIKNIPVEMPYGWSYDGIFKSANLRKPIMVENINSIQKDNDESIEKTLPQTATQYPIFFLTGIFFILLSIFISLILKLNTNEN